MGTGSGWKLFYPGDYFNFSSEKGAYGMYVQSNKTSAFG
jgi:hypothetical protein